jgi:hypothetical protein
MGGSESKMLEVAVKTLYRKELRSFFKSNFPSPFFYAFLEKNREISDIENGVKFNFQVRIGRDMAGQNKIAFISGGNQIKAIPLHFINSLFPLTPGKMAENLEKFAEVFEYDGIFLLEF